MLNCRFGLLLITHLEQPHLIAANSTGTVSLLNYHTCLRLLMRNESNNHTSCITYLVHVLSWEHSRPRCTPRSELGETSSTLHWKVKDTSSTLHWKVKDTSSTLHWKVKDTSNGGVERHPMEGQRHIQYPPLEGQRHIQYPPLEGQRHIQYPPLEGQRHIQYPPLEGQRHIQYPPLEGQRHIQWKVKQPSKRDIRALSKGTTFELMQPGA